MYTRNNIKYIDSININKIFLIYNNYNLQYKYYIIILHNLHCPVII